MATLPRIAPLPRMPRGIRRPSLDWIVKYPPFCFQPVAIHPVIPGETLKNARWQCRAITDPIKGRLIGWWLEHYVFYVPASALEEQDSGIKDMFISLDLNLAANVTRSDVNYQTDDGSVMSAPFMELAVDAIINRWFREEDEFAAQFFFGAGSPPGHDRWYKVKCQAPGWTDSLRLTADAAAVDVDIIDAAGTDVLQASELEDAMRRWELMRMQGLTTQTYEEYLMTHGVRVPQEPGVGEVELLRYSRAWQYPSNTVVPTTGAVTSAVSWSVNESADKDRFFKEPGFIVIGTCARPKVYFSKQTSYAASQMSDALAWLPATLWEDTRVGIRKLANDQLIKDIGAAHEFDVKDLMMYGDQFVNDLAMAEGNLVDLPDTAANVQYITDANIKTNLFVSDAAYFVTQDGHCELSIASSTKDPEPVRSGA